MNEIELLPRFTEVTIFPTFKCNLNCKYCLHNTSDFFKNKSEKLQPENIIKLKKFLNKYKHPDLPFSVFYNGGEPTLDWEYFYDISSLLRTFRNTKLTLVSNLSLDYTKEQIDIIGNIYDFIGISLDGLEEAHDIGRGKGTYKKVLENFFQLYSKFKNKVMVSHTITEDNAKYLYDTHKYFNLMGVNHSYTIDYFTKKNNPKIFIQTVLSNFNNIVNEEQSLNYISAFNSVAYCIKPEMTISLNPDGTLTHCSLKKKDKQIILCDLNKSIDLDYEALNETRGIYIRKECNGCGAQYFCGYGCHAVLDDEKLADVFCSIQQGFELIKRNFLKTEAENEIHDSSM